MVTRKPVPSSANRQSTDSALLRYPVTPVPPSTNTDFQERVTGDDDRSGLNADSRNPWNEDLGQQVQHGIRKSPSNEDRNYPDSLRVGLPEYTPRTSSEGERPIYESKNPYLRKQQPEQGGPNGGIESSTMAWRGFAERTPQIPNEPPPPPPPISKEAPPTIQLENISTAESSSNPWQPSLDNQAPSKKQSVPSIQHEDSGNDVWSDTVAPTRLEPIVPPSEPLMFTDEPESPAWDEPSPVLHEPSTNHLIDLAPHDSGENEWQSPNREGKDLEAERESQRALTEEYLRSGEGWDSSTVQPQESGVIGADSVRIESTPELLLLSSSEDVGPSLPPRPSQDIDRPSMPPRPLVDATAVVSPGASLDIATITAQQKKETYEIKKITWYDATATSNPRTSPILVQNANGPCPLLALVNALTLSTPANLDTALVETLRSREQVSLGLLLEAVLDELMSGRRGDGAQELPDVSDLYSFLITLHTGMNVNPRFIPLAADNTPSDPRNSMSHVHPIERDEAIPGTFEETREMRLYSTFSIPLIHGWLPSTGDRAYGALSRSAKTYEDAQNLMFGEEVLEDKLQSEGLSFEEQATLEDIATIKAFFNSSATQLTQFGLETITKSLAPGAVAILFRNDHFSTLYKHPESHQLLHLVTDMGYAGHEEVVWESLSDTNGENCEFFSGDFRLVGGGSTHSASQNRISASSQSIEATSFNQTNSQYEPPSGSPGMSNTEQEDHDLALALQLQEEEEERLRNEQARRRRETELSQQYIEQQGGPQSAGNIPVSTRGGSQGQGRGRGLASPRGSINNNIRPTIPPRRNNTGTGTIAPSPATRVDPEAGIDVPPPSYEQAANLSPYDPPTGHPAHPSASPNNTTETTPARRVSSAYNSSRGQSSSSSPRPISGRPNSVSMRANALINEVQTGRRPQGYTMSQQQHDERSKDCILM